MVNPDCKYCQHQSLSPKDYPCLECCSDCHNEFQSKETGIKEKFSCYGCLYDETANSACTECVRGAIKFNKMKDNYRK